jgi:hypothetical protein
VDERSAGIKKGEEFLRDAGDGISDWWGVELGLIFLVKESGLFYKQLAAYFGW